ncbi:MAG: bifunctional oligoribonuclease/PAP phosphatase NrnA [Clostridia bacterium]|nr:bifunctional oligoribonuclease/PAP phosphatase NrnA [Clostridia bacterium]
MDLTDIAKLIKNGEKDLAVVSHTNPDGDAIGSTLALGLALENMGYNVQLVNQDNIPRIYSFLPGSDLIRSSFLFIPDTIILLDCSDISRVGILGDTISSSGRYIINIDHHVSNTFFGNANYIDTRAAATGEIIYNLINLLDCPINEEIATCLYTAIVTDTGSFQFENTTERTHIIAADLISKGIDLAIIRSFLWENIPPKSVKLQRKLLDTLEMDETQKIAWAVMPYEIYKEYESSLEHIEGFVNYPKSIEGVEIGLFFKEIEPNKVKVGFRSKSKVDVNKLAQKFGGGGHKRAAGCILEAPLKEVIEQVVKEAQKTVIKKGD